MKTEATESQRAARKRRRFLNSCMGEVLVILLLVLVAGTILSLGLPPGALGRAAYPDGCEVSPRFPDNVLKWCGAITREAREQGLSPDLVAALIWFESGGSASIVSRDGTIGLMQVMPRDGIAAGFECKGQPCFADRPSSAELHDPEFNIAYGTELLKGLSDSFRGDLREALKAYGPVGVGYTFADGILGIFERYAR